jgi:hypothetical protein
MLTASLADSKGCPAFSPPDGIAVSRQEGYTGDPFYVSSDGHFVGDDGFVVPMDFEEFFGRFPNYVRNWVRHHAYGRICKEDIEDWSQDLLAHLSVLPAVSKYRETGKNDVVQTFDPFRQYGASERRFKSYINFCLTNHFKTIYCKHARNPLSCPTNISLSCSDGGSDERPEFEATSEYVYSHSSVLSRRAERECTLQQERLRVVEFANFVLAAEPDAAAVLCALDEAGNSGDARHNWCANCGRVATTPEIRDGVHRGHHVGMTQKRFDSAKGTLRELAKKYGQRSPQTTEAVPWPQRSDSSVVNKSHSGRRETL